MFAIGGILWGGVQIFRGWQSWNEQQQRSRGCRSCAIETLPVGRFAFPSTIFIGALVAAGCSGYLFWTFLYK